MAFRNISLSLSAGVATKILDVLAGDVDAWVNIDPNDTYFLGGPGVTTSNGLRLFGSSANTFHTKVRPGDELWAVSPNAIGVNVMVRSA